MSVRDDSRPPRPHLPPLLVAGLAMWGAAAVAWPACALSEGAPLAVLCAAALASAAAIGAAGLRRGRVPVAAVCALAVLVAVGASAGAAAGLKARAFAAERAGSAWACTLTTDAKPSDFGWRAEARVEVPGAGPLAVRLNLPDDAEGLLQGDALVVEGAFSAPADTSRDYYWNAGLGGSISAGSWEPAPGEGLPLGGLRRRAIELVGAHGGALAPLLQALVCGYRAPIESTGSYDRFKTVGLAHLVAVSGAHLSIVTLFVAQLLRVLRLPRRAVAVATALFLAGYVGFTGMPVSALRAALMASTALLALVVDRRASALSALGLCLVVFVGFQPSCALSASFVLSAGSTLGIVLLAPLLSSAAAPRGRLLRAALVEPLALTASSAAATQPYAAALFSQLPLLSPMANVLGAPLFTLACVAGFAAVAASCALPAAAPAAIGLAAAAAAPLDGLVGALARIPGSCLPVDADVAPMAVLSIVIVSSLWAWWPRMRPRALGAVLAASLVLGAVFVAPPRTADEIVMLDVGQGDAFLVRSQGASLLVDTGNQDALLKEACARQGVRRVDWVAVSHPDDDHCGSLEALGDVAAVGGLLVAADLPACPCDACTGLMDTAAREGYGAGVVGLSVGDEVRCGRFTLRVVWPEAFSDEGGNADSLTFLVGWDGDADGEADWTALLCGDAEAPELHAMADALPAGGVDVLKVGHHGSKKSVDDELAQLLDPSIALISVGERNRYGHPAAAVCEALEAAGAAVLRSDERGDVAVAFSMEKLTVATQNGDAAA
ncbi:ComEC/Rec2 family competence protein [uncultured Adlercreutzia sp.]|uniref:ComEC/Rec2 family competence protein n=1 Tax=uncultured Adlercreutzia sp. TaxID=875803 RepID=UPI002676E530|nr:ComEC/Rec2 family competence protein [uncultured Adlercreutzia sp.]